MLKSTDSIVIGSPRPVQPGVLTFSYPWRNEGSNLQGSQNIPSRILGPVIN
jgi:hypothetical protein